MNIVDFLKNHSEAKMNFDKLPFAQKLMIASESDRLNNLGVFEKQSGNHENAIKFYENAISIMPTNDDALINLSLCLLERKSYEYVISLCKAAIKIDPNRAEGYRTIGDVYYSKSNFREVVKWYKRSAARGDKSTMNWLVNGEFLYGEDSTQMEGLFNDIDEFEFVSLKHKRFENGNQVKEMQVGQPRVIKIESNILGNEGYSVSISNPTNGTLVMSSKPMIETHSSRYEINLVGYGNDKLSNSSFEDYGITLHLEAGVVESIILHLFDRSIDIQYYR
jgi:tetratricopeptide (TPR) repeat protein